MTKTRLHGRIVVDASVLVEATGTFTYPEQARSLFVAYAEQDTDLELWIPDLAYPETANAFRRMVLSGAIDAHAARAALGAIIGLPLSMCGTALLVGDAWDLRDTMTAYDACYVALARRLGGRMFTADERLARAADAADVVFLGDL